jgi:hypothetical protein
MAAPVLGMAVLTGIALAMAFVSVPSQLPARDIEDVSMSFGMALGSSFSGALMEATSVHTALRAAAAIGLAGIAVFWVLTKGYSPGRYVQVVGAACAADQDDSA